MFWTPDYTKDSITLPKLKILDLLVPVFPLRGLFSVEHLDKLLKDREYLVLEANLGEAWTKKIHKSGGTKYVKEVNDCDDDEVEFRRDRLIGRRRFGFKAPEAFGGLYYYSNRLMGWHWDAWGILHHVGVPFVAVYMCEPKVWVTPKSEVREAIYFDA